MTNFHDRSHLILRPLAAALGLILLAASCGASEPAVVTPVTNTEPVADSSAPSSSAPSSGAGDADADTSEAAATDGGAADQGGEIRDAVTSGLSDDEQSELDAGISSLSGETRFGIVASQMLYEPTAIEVDGNQVRFLFDEGSVDESFFDCTLAGVLAEEGEVLTFEYPDGEIEC